MKRKSILKQAVALTLALGISLSGSLVAYADEQRIMTETLDKMGGFVGYYDKTVGLYGYIDSYNNNEIAIPAQYYKINAFFNGYAIVRLSEYSSGDDVQNIYAFIDEAGSVLGTHEFFSFDGKSYSMVQPSFYNFVGDPDGYAYYVISYTRTSVEYSAVKYNGESVGQIFKEFAPIKNADGYMLYDTTTPDGYDVDINGVRTEYSFSDEDMIDALVDLYEGAFYVDEAAFEQDVKLFFPDTVEAEQIINEIRNNHTLVPYVPEF